MNDAPPILEVTKAFNAINAPIKTSNTARVTIPFVISPRLIPAITFITAVNIAIAAAIFNNVLPA